MVITRIRIALTVLGVRATGVMVDGVIMVVRVPVTAVTVTVDMVGIADSTFFGR